MEDNNVIADMYNLQKCLTNKELKSCEDKNDKCPTFRVGLGQ